MNRVKLSLVQFTPGMGTPARNMEAMARLVKGIQTDIVVFPELCNTGYSFLSREETMDAAEDLNGTSAQFFKTIAEAVKAVVIAGFVEKAGDKVYNAALIALPGGEIRVYRKMHLFYREKVCFDQGDTGFFVVRHPLKNCTIGVMICNDWRYPEAARSLALQGADIIACPGNLVSGVWQTAMPARALENKVYLAVANRCGTELRSLEDGSLQTLTFNGRSVLYDYNGQPLARAGETEDGVTTVEVDPLLARDKSFNLYNDWLKDRRPEWYINQ